MFVLCVRVHYQVFLIWILKFDISPSACNLSLEVSKKLVLRRREKFSLEKPLVPSLNVLWSVARIPLRSLKRIVDHSTVRFTANPKLALRAQTVGFAAVPLH
jgi:hypothetical protein